jgi:peroxiredoxin
MSELREFAQRKDDFDRLHTRIIAISVDDAEHARIAWEKAADKKFTVLSDPGAKVIQAYGLLHAGGHRGDDIAIRTTILIDKAGRAQWQRVSETVQDVPTVEEVLTAVRKLPSQ